MVIDDDIDLINLYTSSLKAAGLETVGVNQSAAAHEMALLVQPDLFIIDLMMPDVDGFEMCTMLRKNQLFRNTPILVVTALADANSKTTAMKAGASDYITKPFRMDELKERINKLLQDNQ